MAKYLNFRLFILALATAWIPSSLLALTPAELESRFKQLPTVPEDELPELSNQPTAFRGLIEHDGLEGHTWVAFPFVENPGSFGFDPQGRLYVAEANRFWLGVPDLRGATEMIRDDFKSEYIEDRTKMYEKFSANFPEGWFNRVADRLILLEDKDGNGAADHRTLFSDRFKETLDGIGFSVLADDGNVYFTCIPSVWKLTDTDNDGVADEEEELARGFGVKVSFIGHDLHGITRGPDGMLYFSVGDRGYNLTTKEGQTYRGPSEGAIFRCESDGSNFEVVCNGLRNPQELAFDNYGNLFTFDNTGDIGDLARMVYALEGTDSGWDMSHQSPHQYATHLDWGEFRPETSMWVKERMYDTYNEEQPQWVYPPASHAARGPSGVTYLTGESIPENLRDQFLVANYRGPSANCTGLIIKVEPKGAGYHVVSEEILFKGVGVSDVELGYDGNIYICDFGGGWSVNENGSIQVMKSKNPEQQAAGARVATLFKEGFADRSVEELTSLLSDADRRVRQAAQFALVDQGEPGIATLQSIAKNSKSLYPRLHGIWGLGQAARGGNTAVVQDLIALLKDEEAEVRANAVRVLGDVKATEARDALIASLKSDASPRVQSLVPIALSRICEKGDKEVVDLLFQATVDNGNESPDIVIRHAHLTAISRLAMEEQTLERVNSDSKEARLLALLSLRRMESQGVIQFLNDKDPLIVREAVRAIYDTDVVDTDAGVSLASLTNGIALLPETVQRRIVAANYRRGGDSGAANLLSLASHSELHDSVRIAALQGLKSWGTLIETDPVHGDYRPVVLNSDRTLESLTDAIGEDLRDFLTQPHDPVLITLALQLSTAIGVELAEDTLLTQVSNEKLPADLRVAVLASLAKSGSSQLPAVVQNLLDDKSPEVKAAAVEQAFAIPLEGIEKRATFMIEKANPLVARAALQGVGAEKVAELWANRDKKLRPEIQLDAYLLLAAAGDADAAAYATEKMENVFLLSTAGGDPEKGDVVFRNQGACLQCHKVGKDGGVQGPDLTTVGKRLTPDKILESIYNPGAEITKGYGMTTVILKSGDSVVGRLSKETKDVVEVIGLDNSVTSVPRSDIQSVAPPVSAMPPMAAALPPTDLRDLVAYLAARQGGKGGNDASHGDDDEKIAK